MRIVHQRDALAEHAARVVKTQALLALALANRVEGRTAAEIAASAELRRFTADVETQFPEVLSVLIVDAQGVVQNGTANVLRAIRDVSDREEFMRLRDGAAQVYSGRFRSVTNGEEGFSFAIPRRSTSGGFDGAIAVAVRVGYFSSFYRMAVAPGSTATLAHRDGMLLARYPAAPPDIRFAAFTPPEAAQDDEGQGLRRSPVNGGMDYFAYRQIADTPLVITFAVPRNELMERWRERVGLYGAYVLPGLLLLTMLAGLTWRSIATLDRAVQTRTMALATALAEQERALADRETLLQEVHHRVKNNLQIVSSLVRSQARIGADHESTVRRIQAMALVHELIYAMPGSFAALDLAIYTRRLVDALLQTVPGSVDVTFDLDSVVIDLDRALPFGLILSEAASNAFKNGAPEAPNRVRIALKTTTEALVLEITRHTTPSDSEATGDAFGPKLIARLAVQLHATVSTTHGDDTVFTLRLPNGNNGDFRQN